MQSSNEALAHDFDRLSPQPPDALLHLIALHRADQRAHKIDLGVGVYRDAFGKTSVMRSIKSAELQLWKEQDSKSYLGAEGDSLFVQLLGTIAFGEGGLACDRLTGVQTPGGTGALRLGAELVARSHPNAQVWIGSPSWLNHAPIFRDAGLMVREHRFFDVERGDLDFDGMMQSLADARPGDIILLHGCCHNPTGSAFTASQWQAISDLLERQQILPFLDMAYQGLGNGLEEDAAGVRYVLARAPSALVAYSCDKNFAVYRDRVGALWVQAANARSVQTVRQNLLVLARHLWSMPPDHGAAVVRTALSDPLLKADWCRELADMRQRLRKLRRMLSESHPRLAPLAQQEGLFALLPLTAGDVVKLRENDAIYMAGNGRINIAGLTEASLPYLADAIGPLLDRPG